MAIILDLENFSQDGIAAALKVVNGTMNFDLGPRLANALAH
jgi:hypothetical protein